MRAELTRRAKKTLLTASGGVCVSATVLEMSALPPIADMCGATRHVRYVPKADKRPGDLRFSSLVPNNLRRLSVNFINSFGFPV